MAAFLGGEVCALSNTGAPVVMGALAFVGIVVVSPATLFALQMLSSERIRNHADVVLNMTLAAPVVAFAVATGVTAI